MSNRTRPSVPPQLGIGIYSVPEAARLLGLAPLSIRRWLCGYAYTRQGTKRIHPSLWTPQFPASDESTELGFRDLIELRFVAAFIAEGIRLPVIRACLATARGLVGNHPFSTRRFRTDGRTIYLESLERFGSEFAEGPMSAAQVLDLRSRQYVFAQVIDQTFRDLDVDSDTVVRWRPFKGRSTIVIDPRHAFGQPVTAAGHVPTVAVAGAVAAEGNAKRVAWLYDIPVATVRDAVAFETRLAAA